MTDDRMLQQHKTTYARFLKFAAYGSSIVVVILLLMALFLL